jgi:hypothetical protein
MLSPEKHVAKSPQASWQIIENEIFIVTSKNSMLHTSNKVGVRIWELINGKRKIKEIARNISEEFDVDYETAEKDLLEFINKLSEKGMVVLPDDK